MTDPKQKAAVDFANNSDRIKGIGDCPRETLNPGLYYGFIVGADWQLKHLTESGSEFDEESFTQWMEAGNIDFNPIAYVNARRAARYQHQLSQAREAALSVDVSNYKYFHDMKTEQLENSYKRIQELEAQLAEYPVTVRNLEQEIARLKEYEDMYKGLCK